MDHCHNLTDFITGLKYFTIIFCSPTMGKVDFYYVFEDQREINPIPILLSVLLELAENKKTPYYQLNRRP
ncbi:unnamed protein product [Onchocerca flexuosa]|uniref:Ovule protein n=1 Tax=Onchocerca flexuosa TaxID=387005 RepID=A0A183HYQ2_9BILA|nr:unnamed protein product [Onchocerca flexuosa]